MRIIILIVASYCLGSIPFGFLVVYFIKRVDIRRLGSGNIGATNVTRVLGKRWGIFVFVLDFLKGFIVLFLVPVFLENNVAAMVFIFVGLAAVCGHNWTIFLKFKGGKGVSTSLGVIVGLCAKFPVLVPLFIISVLVWVLIFFISKIVSLASISSVFVFFILSCIFGVPIEFKFFSFILLVFVLTRHKENIKNLLKKNEFRF